MKRVILLTGGARSGKSRKALDIASAYSRKAFIATAEPLDSEMEARIAAHRRERGEGFTTLEESTDLAGAIASLPTGTDVAIIDCLTVWLGNLLYHFQNEEDRLRCIEEFLESLKSPPCNLVIVTNEVGMGIVPLDRSTREYRDLAGGLNQKVAAVSDTVIFMTCGLPLLLKGEMDE